MITTDPDLKSAQTPYKAWRVPTRKDAPAALGAWFIHLPGVHPMWSWWMAAACHLRPIEGEKRPPLLQYPGAEYELMVMALDPAWTPSLDPDAPLRYLLPLDVCFQLDGIGDQGAVKLLDLAVLAMVEGQLAPDSDRRGPFNEALARTVQHFKEGRHALA